MLNVHIPVANSYDVIIGNGVLNQLDGHIRQLLPKAQKLAVITDENVASHYLETTKSLLEAIGCQVLSYIIKPGEASKSAANYLLIQEWLAANNVTGTDGIIALGGGVVGDLAGFVAATYLRGTPYIQVPTSLLAMVDSSVGGKTAIDLPAGKNLVGAFYQPKLVLCDTDLLATLPQDIYHDGFSEIIKYGMLGSASLLAELAKDHFDLNGVVAQCVAMKRDIVIRDEFDKGDRKLLNFGHTIGHAIEQVSGYEVSHGKAVAIGMVLDTIAAVETGRCPADCQQILLNLLEKFQLPTTTSYSAEELFAGSQRDKKREGGSITAIVPYELGRCRLEQFSMEEQYQWIKKGMSK